MNDLVNRLTRRSLKMLLTAVLLAFSSTAAFASPADDKLRMLADEYIDALSVHTPVWATVLGDHRRDDQIDDVSSAGRQKHRQALKGIQDELSAIDWNELTPANQVDAAMLSNSLGSSLFAIDTLREWSWNPLHYVDIAGQSVYGLMARDFAPLEQRLINVASRLEKLPAFLDQARGVLVPELVPKIHAETAIAQNSGILAILDNMIVPALETQTGETSTRVIKAIEVARAAIAEHQLWLEEKLLPQAAGDFRIGPDLFDQKLAFTLDSPLTRQEIDARAKAEYTAVRDEMYEVSKEVYAEQYPYASLPEAPDESFKQVIIRAALERAYKELPDRDRIVEIAREYVDQATDFVIEKNLVTLPDDPIKIIVMPEFQRGVSVAYLDPAGPLDENAASFYAVAPLPADWTEEQISSFLREYNLYSMQSLSIHEGIPGHHMQLALSNRYESILRSVLWSGPFVEGWGVYAERLMVEAGYLDGNPLMRLINLKWYLRSITNAIMDQGIHVEGMSREDAMKLMVEGGFQEEREAAGKWVRAQLSSTQLSTYFVGFQEHIDMRAAVVAEWGEEFTLQRYHDQALSYGSPPVKYVRALMLDEQIPQPANLRH